MRHVGLAIFDLDNTLYDWYASFLPAFYSMVDTATAILQCDREGLLDELRSVHVKHHDVEHPFSLLETSTVQKLIHEHGVAGARSKLDPAFHAFNKVRKENLTLFPDVRATLEELHAQEIKLVAFTDSSYFAAIRRIRQLDLVNVFERIFCRAKSDGPLDGSYFGPEINDNLASIMIELPADEAKPDPRVLQEIAEIENIAPSAIAYVGDSVSRDILMAKRAGCFAIWARYGVHRDPLMYEKLIRISHWTDADIQRERNFAAEASAIVPDFICESSIAELLTVLVGPVRKSEHGIGG
jgi:FMN phosphatase YigB (HAD superfamily)